MRPPGDATPFRRPEQRSRPAEELQQKPHQEIDDRRDRDKQGEDQNRDQGNHHRVWKEQEIGPHHPRNRPGGANGWIGRSRVGQGVADHGDNSAEKIEQEEPKGPHAVLHIVTEYPQGPHVAENVEKPAMQEHAGQKWPVAESVVTMQRGGGGVCKNERDDSKEMKEGLKLVFGQQDLENKNPDIGKDQKPCDHRRVTVRDGVSDGEHRVIASGDKNTTETFTQEMDFCPRPGWNLLFVPRLNGMFNPALESLPDSPPHLFSGGIDDLDPSGFGNWKALPAVKAMISGDCCRSPTTPAGLLNRPCTVG
ncbi:MAG: hypothetical protein DIKNOCCD_00492 [bacterium]|nr:hypothetical protein [bacterium]